MSSAVTQSPTPVVVVDDPLNPWDVAGVVTGLLVGTVSVFLAWQAVRIGARAAAEAEIANREATKARAAVARERRRAFELEVLRDMLDLFDVRTRRSGGFFKGPGVSVRALPDFESDLSVSELVNRARPRLLLLTEQDLPSWRNLLDHLDDDQDGWRAVVVQLAGEADDQRAFATAKEKLAQEVVAAIRWRVEVEDD